jgi:hypothetical protein
MRDLLFLVVALVRLFHHDAEGSGYEQRRAEGYRPT